MPIITNAEYNQLKKRSARLIQLEEEKEMKPFIQDFISFVSMAIAHSTKKSWPDFIRFAFNTAAVKHPYGAKLYEERLPK